MILLIKDLMWIKLEFFMKNMDMVSKTNILFLCILICLKYL